MRAGTLRDRISIEGDTPGFLDPNYGPQPGTWGVIYSRIAANVQDALPSKSEAVEQGMEVSSNRIRVRIRHRTGIDSSMRVVVHGKRGDPDRVLSIVGGPAVLGNRDGIELMCEAYSIPEG